jgi:hypothetical protein
VIKRALDRWSTEELETAIYSGSLDAVQKYEAERILRERESVPLRRLARRTYNAAAWTLAFSLGTFIVYLLADRNRQSPALACHRLASLPVKW